MYNQFYNFSERPFNLTPDPKFLYLTPSHREALAAMLYGIKERKGFISVTGEVGTGKTTLIYSLLKQCNERIKTVFIFHTNISFEQLLENILLELEVPIVEGGKSANLRQLNKYLIQKLSHDENLAIIIDEAQNLSKEVMEELRMLSNLETPKSKLLQMVLVGQPELEVKLDSEDLRQLKQRIGIRRRISPLNPEECVKYIDHRLSVVGSSASRIFASAAISLICDYSKGIPRTINILCDNALLIGYGLSRKKVDADIIREVMEDMEASVSRVAFRSESVRDKVSQHIKHSKPWVLDDRRQKWFSKTHVIVLLILCLVLFLILGKLYRIINHPKNISDGSNLSSKILHSNAETALTSSGKFPLSSKEPKPLDAGTSSSSNLFPSETREDSVTSSSIQAWPTEDKPPDTTKSLSLNLISSDLKADPESRNPIQIQPGDLKPEAPDDPGTKGKIKGIVAAKKKDCIFSLAQKYYRAANKTLADFILQSNPEISNIHLISVNQQIKIPDITDESPIIRLADDSYKIYLGTFSARISAGLYNREPSLDGKRLEIISFKVSPGETWHRIIAGKFDSKEECLKVIGLLRERALLPIFEGNRNMRRSHGPNLKQ